jgi:hypothetical protein
MDMTKPFRSLLLAAAAALVFTTAAAAAEPNVDVELVLAIDVSGSVDPFEARQQRDGYVAALTHPDVIAAIQGGALGKIAVMYLEWAGMEYQRVVVPWTVIDGEASAKQFVAALEEVPPLPSYWTGIGAAIQRGIAEIEGNAYEGQRKVIDVSGDGMNNNGYPVQLARDQAVAKGITVNGLPILNDRPNPFGQSTPRAQNLDAYYEQNVIGGSDAFIVPAEGFEAFKEAILSKLIREIANLNETPKAAQVAEDKR